MLAGIAGVASTEARVWLVVAKLPPHLASMSESWEPKHLPVGGEKGKT
jgi:hypothetical protein